MTTKTTAKAPSKAAMKKVAQQREARNAALKQAASQVQQDTVQQEAGKMQAIPLAPPPPLNPIVIELQRDVLSFVTTRSQAMVTVQQANAALRHAEAAAKSAQESLVMIESEIQYRMQLAAQMQGQPVPLTIGGAALQIPRFEQPLNYAVQPADISLYGVPREGIGSVPAPPRFNVAPQDDVRSESAEDERRAL